MKVENTSPRQGVRRAQTATTADDTSGGNSEFRTLLQNTLNRSGAGNVSEEALFSSLVHDRVTKTGNVDALKKFEARIEKHRKILEKHAGYASEEKAAKFALRDLVRKDLISKDDASKMYSAAFSAAQLDSDTESLSDGIGSETLAGATTTVEDADTKANLKMAAFDSGAEAPTVRNIGEGTARVKGAAGLGGDASLIALSDSPVDGSLGFLFKPVSDTQGKLVVLAPESLTNKIDGIVLKDEDGKVIESGQFSGVGNGERAHFRFSKPGSSYPNNLTVEIQLSDGGVKSYAIPDPSARYD